MKNINLNQFLTIFGLVLFASLTRLLPHPWNTTAIGALALFSGSVLSSRALAVVVTLVSLLLTDLMLGFHGTMLFTYTAFAAIAVFSVTYLHSRRLTSVISASVFASLFFFAVSNFGVWYTSGFYPRSTQGLITCYLAGLPFLDNQVFGDLFYAGILFGVYALCEKFLGFSVEAQERV